MRRRTKLKRRARARRNDRRHLVHAAGCVYENCLIRLNVLEGFAPDEPAINITLLQEARLEGLRIPRSLRGKGRAP